MLSFLYPAFLIGAAAAAIPVLLHLLRNQQAPELRFGAVRLLRGVKVEHAQRRRIRDWLLLALRVSALMLLAFAFARPYLPGRPAAAGRAAVIVLDRSASMGAGGVWSRARAAVLNTIEHASPGEALALVAFDDCPELVVEPTFDRGSIRAALDRLKPGVGATRYPPALSRAVSLLDSADDVGGRVVLVSDLQGTPAEARATIPESIRLEVTSVAASFDNVAILAARRDADGLVATLRNDGGAPRQTRVRVTSGEQVLAETDVTLPPSDLVEVPLRATARGAREIRVSLTVPDENGLTIDDARYVDFGTSERPRVLVIAPPQGSFYVDAALRAGGAAADFDITSSQVQGTAPALAQRPAPQVVFLIGPRGLDRGGREALLRFAQAGGGLFIAASDALNEPGFGPLLEGMEIAVPPADEAVLALGSFEGRHPLFRRLGQAGDAMAGARFTRAWRVRAPGWQVLARFDDGAGALFERAVGTGRVVVFASDVNRDWNDLPLQTAFVPFVQEMARYLAPPQPPREYTPGTLPSGVQPSLGFVPLTGGRRVVVNPDARESEPGRMDAAQFGAAVRHRGTRRIDAEVLRRRAQAAERGQGLWRYGLMLMFVALVTEGLVGSRGRRA